MVDQHASPVHVWYLGVSWQCPLLTVFGDFREAGRDVEM